MNLIDVKQLSVQIGETRKGEPHIVVNDVAFSIAKGEILGIVGESGSGKSMTAYALQGLLPRKAEVISGLLKINGRAIDLNDPEQMRELRKNDFSMVFQNPMSCLNPLHKIGAQVGEALPESEPNKKQRVYDMLREVQLKNVEELYHAYPHQLSGGMQQRVMIAMALIAKPSFLIADEPTTALDVTTEAEIIQLILTLTKKYATTVIFISHDLAVIRAVADQVAVMYNAEIVEYGETEVVYNDPHHAYTKALLNAIPRPQNKGQKLLTIADGMRASAGEQGAVDGTFRFAAEVSPKGQSAEMISVSEISKIYKNRMGRIFGHNSIDAVRAVSFALKRGETLGIVGESGSGKSTLAKIICAIETPSSGTVRYLGKNLADMTRAEKKRYRREVQIVFQDSTSSLNPKKRVGWLLEEPLIIHKMPLTAAQRRQKVVSILEDVGLDESYMTRYPHQLSGGQRQRINIALALILEPTVIIADEPVSALDVSVQAQILNLMKRLQREHNLSYLFISHDLGIVYYMSDRIAVMKDGKIVESGDSEQIFYRPQHDYTKKLFAAKSYAIK